MMEIYQKLVLQNIYFLNLLIFKFKAFILYVHCADTIWIQYILLQNFYDKKNFVIFVLIVIIIKCILFKINKDNLNIEVEYSGGLKRNFGYLQINIFGTLFDHSQPVKVSDGHSATLYLAICRYAYE